ncbi:PPE domain-containing protein [Nocardia mangyaensis]|uniref:PPE domain-containing protein n=1 Tax=Nocardia mangyaensis TaxID=2213200 RepID=UPI002675FCC1|nr:PPE domain-containing protein [Nocardia mangyaensis]MDO3647285.1 PPE domain-containing protein [Nocardia mangyaensis]
MIEPPQPGFTGVVWEAREPSKLAADLTAGAGPMPMADAAAAWTRLAAAFGAAVLDYEQVLQTLRGSWKSGSSEQVWERISTLREWLVETAAAATANAARMHAQVLAYEVAAMAMPNTADIAAITAMQQALEQVGAALGAPIKAIAAQTDTEADAAKAVASRVMRSYEAATEPLATPWLHAPPPPIAPESALAGEQSGKPSAAPGVPGVGVMPRIGGLGALPIPVPVQTAYRAPSFVQSTAAVGTTAPQAAPVATPTGHAPLVPGAMAAGVGAQDSAARFPRAGIAYEESDQLVAEGEIQAAPAVLGVAERAAAPTGEATATAEGKP